MSLRVYIYVPIRIFFPLQPNTENEFAKLFLFVFIISICFEFFFLIPTPSPVQVISAGHRSFSRARGIIFLRSIFVCFKSLLERERVVVVYYLYATRPPNFICPSSINDVVYNHSCCTPRERHTCAHSTCLLLFPNAIKQTSKVVLCSSRCCSAWKIWIFTTPEKWNEKRKTRTTHA